MSRSARWRSCAVTHVGMVRKLNEDAYVARDDVGLWAVADGMGGHEAGDVASQRVTEALGDVPGNGELGDLLEQARTAVARANADLIELGRTYDSDRSPGTTVAVLLLRDGRGTVAWAGDSRIYRLRDGQVEQLTRDHSHVQELIAERLITPEQAEQHPMANVITRAVGIEERVELECREFETGAADRYLLCSDGLSRLVSDDEIRELLASPNLDDALKSMLHTALVRGAPDNVTVIAISGDTGQDEDTVIQPS